MRGNKDEQPKIVLFVIYFELSRICEYSDKQYLLRI